MIQEQSHGRIENPARWMKAAERAVSEGVQVRQLQGSGQWIATSGRDQTTAYELTVTGAVAHGCDCLAGLNNDPVCKHRAAYYLLVGALDLDPEPDPPAVVVAGCCPECSGGGVLYVRDCAVAGWPMPTCPVCQGNGIDPLLVALPVTNAPARIAA